MSSQQPQQTKPIGPIILDNWVKFAAAGIITRAEAEKYVQDGYLADWEFKRMFPNA